MSDTLSQGHGDFTPPSPLRDSPGQPIPAGSARLAGLRSPSVTLRPRVWPGVLIAAAAWMLITLPGLLEVPPMVQFLAMFWGPMAATVCALLWWLFASRVRWADRLLVAVACLAMGAGAAFLMHPSFQMGIVIYGLPVVVTAWAGWLALTGFLSWPARRAGLLVALLLAWGACAAVRMDGVDGNFSPSLSPRWSPTEEERSLAEINARTGPAAGDAAAGQPLEAKPGDWVGFRGPRTDGHLSGVRIATDWDANPPKQLWKQRVGPGWSSFAVIGDRLYTQEQRGEAEAVVCYHTDTGAERWVHKEADTRFSEPVGGAGPRATPTFADGKIYAFGARGKLVCLDAATGKLVWSKDVAADSGAKLPQWGFSASPLVAKGIVSVYAGGENGKAVLGYKADTGEPAWSAGTGLNSYCSTQLSRIDGVDVLLVATGDGLTVLDPVSGKVLDEPEWKMQKGMVRVVQPAVVGGSEVLLGTGFGTGTRRIKLTASPAGAWTNEEVWTTRAISPYFNDLVVHKGHLYGFDGAFFTCVNLDEGAKGWRQRGYDNGQVLLLADQDLLLILSEKGEVALVEASPAKHTRLGKFAALDGKTWNHPVVAHGKLFVRNDKEMACFQLKVK